MPVASCPNKSHKDYKKLSEFYGEATAMAIYKRNGEVIPDLSAYETMQDVTREFFPEAASMDETTMNLFQRQKKALADSLNVEVILDASIEGAGQLETGAENVIRVNPQYFGGDTLMHEYGHLYIDMLGGMDNNMIKQGRKYLNGTELEQRITEMYPELSGDKLDKEILASAIGLEGQRIFNASQRTMKTRFLKWLEVFFNRLKSAIGMEANVAQELARQLISNQVSEQLQTELASDVQHQKAGATSPLMSQAEVFEKKANIVKKIKEGLETKLARYNRILNTTTSTSKQKEAIGQLEELVEEFGKKDDVESLTRYVSIGLKETDAMLNRLRNFQTGKSQATTKRLRDIHSYLQSYSHAKEIKGLLEVDADLMGKFRNETMDESDKTSLLQALDQIISNHDLIQSMYRQQSKLLLADKFSRRDGRVHAQYREEYGKEFLKTNKRSRPLIGSAKYMLKGKEVSREEFNQAKKEYINQKMVENKNEIQAQEKQHWLELFELGPTDLGFAEAAMMDPGAINEDLIQVAHEIIERADFRAMEDTVRKYKDADDLYQRFDKEKSTGNQKKKYDEIIENEVDENGKLTGKKSSYMVSEYYSKPYQIWQNFYTRIDEAKKAGNEKKEAEITAELSKWIDDNTVVIGTKRRKLIDKWKNPQYKKLQELGEQGSVIADMYNHLIELREDTESNYPNVNKLNKKAFDQTFYRLPSVNSSNVERVMEKGFLGTIKENLKDILKIRATDVDYRPEQVEEQDSDENKIAKEAQRITKAMGDESGGLVQNIPIYFRSNMDPSDQSYDLLSIHLLDNSMATNYKEKSKIHADIEMLSHISATRDVAKTKSKGLKGISKMVNIFTGEDEGPIRVRGENTQAHKALVSLIESRMYGIRKEGDETINKIVDNVLTWTGDTMLIGNWLSASANLMQGKMQNWIESIGASDFSQKDVVAAEEKYWADSMSWGKDFGRRRFYSKTNLLVEKFNALGDWSVLARRFAEDTRMKGLMKKSTLHGLNGAAEHYIQSTAMYAMLNNIKVKDKNGDFLGRNDDGKIIKVDSVDDAMSIDEAYDVKDGRLILNERVASTTNTTPGQESDTITSDEIQDISFMMRDIQADLQGQYDSRQQSKASRTWYGRSFLILRRWLPRGWMRRFRGGSTIGLDPDDIKLEERFYSRSRGEFKSGLYSDLFRMLWNKRYLEHFREEGVKASFDLMRQNWNELSEIEYANVRRGLTEFAMMGLTISSAALIKGLADDEEDEYQQQGLFYLAFLMARLNSEMQFYVNPQETIRIMRSPAASLSLVENTIHLLDQLIKDMPFTDIEQYERGRRAGEYKLEKDFEDVVPIFNQMNRNVEEALGWLYQETTI